ncbi:MAG TPA: hypothetical protein VLK33_17805, partial [Terriglobales bacterium]|nr:hypothetical protein [Terriglobales bacterium]
MLFRLRIAIVLILGLVGARALYAQGGPPVITDDPGTPGNRRWEINVGFTQEKTLDETNFEVPVLDLNYGAGDHIQLNFEIPYALQNANSDVSAGLGNSKVGVKWRFMDEDKRGVSVSTYPHIIWNNPSNSVRRGLVDDGWQVFLPIEFSKQLGKFQINGEAGYNIQQRLSNEVWLGVVTGYQATHRVELLGELHTIGARRFAENESVFDLGSRIKLNKLNTLLFAAGRSLPGSTDGQPKF